MYLIQRASAKSAAVGSAIAVSVWISARYLRWFAGSREKFAPVALLPDFGSSKMPERDLRELAAAGDFDPRTALIFTYGQMGHSVAFLLRRPDTRIITSLSEMKYGATRAREAGEPLLFLNDEEFVYLLTQPDRPDVVYISITDRIVPQEFTAFPHRRVRRREMELLVFPPYSILQER